MLLFERMWCNSFLFALIISASLLFDVGVCKEEKSRVQENDAFCERRKRGQSREQCFGKRQSKSEEVKMRKSAPEQVFVLQGKSRSLRLWQRHGVHTTKREKEKKKTRSARTGVRKRRDSAREKRILAVDTGIAT